jgi:hypothetical protein
MGWEYFRDVSGRVFLFSVTLLCYFYFWLLLQKFMKRLRCVIIVSAAFMGNFYGRGMGLLLFFRHTFINLECRWCGGVNCEGGADYFVQLCGRCILFHYILCFLL